MSITQSENQNQNENNNNIDKEINPNSKQARIQKMKEASKQFQEETKQRFKLAPNVPTTVRFPKDFYNDYDSLLDEQILVHKKTLQEAAEYAEKNYKVRRKLEEPTDGSNAYARTTYRVKLPNTKYPEMERELQISSKKGIEAINDKLAEIAMNTDSDILLQILMKQGASKFQTEWEVTGTPYNP